MVASQIRANARESLKGKWGKAALLTLCFSLVYFVIFFLLNLIPVIGYIVSIVISLPISFGLLASFMKLKRGEDVGYTDFLNLGFANFGKVWAVLGNIVLKMIIPIVLVIVFLCMFIFGMGASFTNLIATAYSSSNYFMGSAASFGGIALIGFFGYIASIIYTIIKGYLYYLSYYILFDNPDKSAKEIVEESEYLMKGNRWSFFWLGLTFVGWVILSVFTLYIGMLWVFPYMMIAFVCFYEALANKTTNTTAEESNPVVEK